LEEHLSPAELKFLEQQLSSSVEDTGRQFVPVSDTLGEDIVLLALYSYWKTKVLSSVTVLYFSKCSATPVAILKDLSTFSLFILSSNKIVHE
jgi:hypothetical protein